MIATIQKDNEMNMRQATFWYSTVYTYAIALPNIFCFMMSSSRLANFRWKTRATMSGHISKTSQKLQRLLKRQLIAYNMLACNRSAIIKVQLC